MNVLAGKGSVVGQRLIEHADVAKIGFTGRELGMQAMDGYSEVKSVFVSTED